MQVKEETVLCRRLPKASHKMQTHILYEFLNICNYTVHVNVILLKGGKNTTEHNCTHCNLQICLMVFKWPKNR